MASFPSSYIPTTTASATRAADVLTVSSPGVTYPLSLFAEYSLDALNAVNSQTLMQIDNGSATDRILLISNTSNLLAAQMITASSLVANVSVGAAHVVNTTYRAAARAVTNDTNAARSGTAGTADTSCTAPATPTNIRFGTNSSGADLTFGYLRRAAIINSSVNDAGLQSMTL